MSYSSYKTVVNAFEPEPYAKELIKRNVVINCKIELDKEVYSVGEVVSGTVTLQHRNGFRMYGLLLVLDGTIKASTTDSRGRTWKDAVTNLHIFTYAIRSRNKRNMIFYPGSKTYEFAIKIPYANIPGTLETENGSISYRIVAVGVQTTPAMFITLGEKSIEILAYLNLNLLSSQLSIDDLAAQSWQTKEGVFPHDKLKFKAIKTYNDQQSGFWGFQFNKTENLVNSLISLKKTPKFQLGLRLQKLFFIIGDEIYFEVSVDNPNGEWISKMCFTLLLRTIYTTMQSTVTNQELVKLEHNCSNNNSKHPSKSKLSWIDRFFIPSDLKIVSSVAAARQPLITQHVLRIDVFRDGKEFSGELQIGIGTTELVHPKPRKLVLDLEQCSYPVGISEMYYPEDWDKMYKTGRIGFVENPFAMPEDSNCMPFDALSCTSSFASLASVASSSTRSSKWSMPPSYSALSSRRTSCESLPSYNLAVGK